MRRLLAWVAAIIAGWQKHHKPGHKPTPGPPLSAVLDERVRVSSAGVAQVSGPEFIRVSAAVLAVLSGHPSGIPIAVVIGEIVRVSASGAAKLATVPEIARITDLVAGLMTVHAPVMGGIVCDFCSDEVRVTDCLLASRTP